MDKLVEHKTEKTAPVQTLEQDTRFDFNKSLAVDIVVASINHGILTNPKDIPERLNETYSVLTNLKSGENGETIKEALVPAVDPKKSIAPEYLICLDDGLKFKSLKRHLSTKYGMTPEEYRKKWDLPSDYPMVAPNYSAARSQLAVKAGLGRKLVEERRAARKK